VKPDNDAFKALANGKFESGLYKLSTIKYWQDGRDDLDGPFNLWVPEKCGWGEGLLFASLLKRYARSANRRVEAVAGPQICSILKDDGDFLVSARNEKQGRSPLALLRHALTGTLLDEPFEPIHTSKANSVDHQRNYRIGIAWASINGKRTIWQKSIPSEKFQTIIAMLPGSLVSFQQCEEQAGKIELECERPFSESDYTSPDQSPILRQINDLTHMVTISTTTAHIAAALGIKVFLLAKRRKGPQWFLQAQADFNKKLYPEVSVFLGYHSYDCEWWENPLASVTRELAELGG
jgi:hypothetical protein